MKTFKVKNRSTATALAAYWKQAFGVTVTVVNFETYQELQCTDFGEIHPGEKERALAANSWWREVCEAFTAGRSSVVD